MLLLNRTILMRNISEALYESDGLPKPARDAAALVASKVYYFLGEYDEALSFALGSGNAFQAETRAYGSEEYVETIICALLKLISKLLVANIFSSEQLKLLIDISKRVRLNNQVAKRRSIPGYKRPLRVFLVAVYRRVNINKCISYSKMSSLRVC